MIRTISTNAFYLVSLVTYAIGIMFLIPVAELEYSIQSMGLTIMFCAVSLISGILGTVLSFDKFLTITITIALVLLNGTAILGCALELQDKLCDCGYNNFGAVILIMIGIITMSIAGITTLVMWTASIVKTLKERTGKAGKAGKGTHEVI